MQALSERIDEWLRGATFEGYEPLGFTGLKTAVPSPDQLVGHALVRVDRRAKYVILHFDTTPELRVVQQVGNSVDASFGYRYHTQSASFFSPATYPGGRYPDPTMTSVLIAINKRYKVPASGIRITGVPDAGREKRD